MKKTFAFLSMLILTIFVSSELFAQFNVSTLSAQFGMIRNLQESPTPPGSGKYSFYPEIQVGGQFFVPYLRWRVYFGAWDDGVTRAVQLPDFITYSYSSQIVGGRLTFLPKAAFKKWPIPLDVSAGLSHHFVNADYVGGFGVDGLPGKDFREGSTTAEFGIGSGVRVGKRFRVRGEVTQFLPLGNSGLNALDENRMAFKIGLIFGI